MPRPNSRLRGRRPESARRAAERGVRSFRLPIRSFSKPFASRFSQLPVGSTLSVSLFGVQFELRSDHVEGGFGAVSPTNRFEKLAA